GPVLRPDQLRRLGAGFFVSENLGRSCRLLRRRDSIFPEHAAGRRGVCDRALRGLGARRKVISHFERSGSHSPAISLKKTMGTAQRIVSFLPSATEMVCALGLGDRL